MSRNTICRSNKSYCPSDLTNRDESPIAKLADFLPHIYKSNFSSLIFFILNNIRYCKLFSFGFGYFHVLTTVRRTFKQLYLRVNRSCSLQLVDICVFVYLSPQITWWCQDDRSGPSVFLYLVCLCICVSVYLCVCVFVSLCICVFVYLSSSRFSQCVYSMKVVPRG